MCNILIVHTRFLIKNNMFLFQSCFFVINLTIFSDSGPLNVLQVDASDENDNKSDVASAVITNLIMFCFNLIKTSGKLKLQLTEILFFHCFSNCPESIKDD